jgi:hypothetical protein
MVLINIVNNFEGAINYISKNMCLTMTFIRGRLSLIVINFLANILGA